MATKKHKAYEPWKCEKCGAWVFTQPNLHAPLCHLYRECPSMVKNTVEHYEYLKKTEIEEQGKKRKKS